MDEIAKAEAWGIWLAMRDIYNASPNPDTLEAIRAAVDSLDLSVEEVLHISDNVTKVDFATDRQAFNAIFAGRPEIEWFKGKES